MFTVDLFRFPPSAQVGRHTQDNWEVSMVVHGSGVRTIGETTEPFVKREVVAIPPGVPHQWSFNPDDTDAAGNVVSITVKFSETTLKTFATLCPGMAPYVTSLLKIGEPMVFVGPEAAALAGLLTDMTGQSDVYRLPLIASMLRIISCGNPHHKLGSFRPRPSAMLRLDRIRVFVECNASRHVSLDDTAAMMGLGRSSLCCFIKRHTGKTFSEYVNGVRIEKSCRLLAETDDRISSIAYDCGFRSIPYFNRVFLSIKGVSPSAFRKSNSI